MTRSPGVFVKIYERPRMREKLTEDAHEADFSNDLTESQKHENTHDIEKNRDVYARDAAQLVVPWLHGD